MPSWKKLYKSGSDAHLNTISSSGGFHMHGGKFVVTSSSGNELYHDTKFYNRYNTDSFFHVEGFHVDGRMRLRHDMGGSAETIINMRGTQALGFGEGLYSGYGMSSAIGIRGSDQIPVAAGFIVGVDSFAGGTHQSLHIRTPDVTYGVTDYVDIGTFSVIGNTISGSRPYLRLTGREMILQTNSGSDTDVGSGYELMRMSGSDVTINGNLGINTSPLYALHSVGVSGLDGNVYFLNGSNSRYYKSGNTDYLRIRNTTNYFSLSSADNSKIAFVIDNAGNIGIGGVTAPSKELDVTGSVVVSNEVTASALLITGQSTLGGVTASNVIINNDLTVNANISGSGFFMQGIAPTSGENTVLVQVGQSIYTQEINSLAWSNSLVTSSAGVDNRIAVYKGQYGIEGDNNFTWNGSSMNVNGSITASAFSGDGSQLTGITAEGGVTASSGGNTRVAVFGSANSITGSNDFTFSPSGNGVVNIGSNTGWLSTGVAAFGAGEGGISASVAGGQDYVDIGDVSANDVYFRYGGPNFKSIYMLADGTSLEFVANGDQQMTVDANGVHLHNEAIVSSSIVMGSGTGQFYTGSFSGDSIGSTGEYLTFTAVEALSFGDVVTVTSNGKVGKANAASGSDRTPALAVTTQGSVSANVSAAFLTRGVILRNQWTWSVGRKVYLNTTAGEFTQTTPTASNEIVQVLGVAISTGSVYFNPSLDTIELK